MHNMIVNMLNRYSPSTHVLGHNDRKIQKPNWQDYDKLRCHIYISIIYNIQ